MVHQSLVRPPNTILFLEEGVEDSTHPEKNPGYLVTRLPLVSGYLG